MEKKICDDAQQQLATIHSLERELMDAVPVVHLSEKNLEIARQLKNKLSLCIRHLGNYLEKKRIEKFEERSLDYLEKIYELGHGMDSMGTYLAGCETERCWKLRQKLLPETLSEISLAQGLAGCESNRAWQFREKLVRDGLDVNSLISSMNGCDSDRAWNYREEILSLNTNIGKRTLAQSLRGCDSQRAWKFREKLMASGAFEVDSIILGISGCNSETAWDFREKCIDDMDGMVNNGTAIARSLNGLDSERAWDFRYRLLEEGVTPTFIMWGLAGCDSQRAWDFREEHKFISGIVILQSIAGCDSDKAWKLRNECFGDPALYNWVGNSFLGNSRSFVWRLRNRRDDV